MLGAVILTIFQMSPGARIRQLFVAIAKYLSQAFCGKGRLNCLMVSKVKSRQCSAGLFFGCVPSWQATLAGTQMDLLETLMSGKSRPLHLDFKDISGLVQACTSWSRSQAVVLKLP